MTMTCEGLISETVHDPKNHLLQSDSVPRGMLTIPLVFVLELGDLAIEAETGKGVENFVIGKRDSSDADLWSVVWTSQGDEVFRE